MGTATRLADEPRHRLRALYDLAVELSTIRDLPSVLDVALRQCLELTGSQFGFIGLVSDDQRSLRIAAIRGFRPAASFYRMHRTIPLRPSVFATTVLEDRPVRSVDARIEPHAVGQPDGHPQVVTFLGVPLRSEGSAIGMIGVANRPGAYDESHEHLMATYAAQISIVMRNARLNEDLEQANVRLERTVEDRTAELHRAKDALAQKAAELRSVLAGTVEAQEAERRRISRDLHDGVNQLLIGAMLELQSSQQRIAAGQTDAAVATIHAAQDTLKQVEAELRRVIRDLHPPALDELGLPGALRRLAAEFHGLHGVRCEVVAGAAVPLSGRAAIDLYRVVQEALHNVAEHADAHRVQIRITPTEGQIELAVKDDGRGFDPVAATRTAAGHFGLSSMRERAESLGGRLELRSRPGHGAEVRVTIPLDAS